MARVSQRLYDDGLEVNRQQEGLEVRQPFVTDKQSLRAYNAEPFTQSRASERTNRNPWGLRPLAFGLLVGIITAVVVGAAVGGGVAGNSTSHKESWYVDLEKKSYSPRFPDDEHSSPSSNSSAITLTVTASATTASASPSTALTNYSAPVPSAVSSLFLDCPALNSQSYTNTLFGDKYTQFCGQDFTGGLAAKGGGVIADLVGIIACSVSDCMDACSNVNNLANRWNDGIQCQAMSFSIDLQRASEGLGANCWLKNATIASGTQGNVDDLALSATLG